MASPLARLEEPSGLRDGSLTLPDGNPAQGVQQGRLLASSVDGFGGIHLPAFDSGKVFPWLGALGGVWANRSSLPVSP